MKDQMAESKKLFTVNKSAKWSHHRGRKRAKHSFSSTEIYSRMCSAAFSQVQHCLPLFMYSIQCVARKGGVGLCWRSYGTPQDICTLYGPDSDSTKLLDHPKTKTVGRGGGLRQISLSRLLEEETKRFCALPSMSLSLLRCYPLPVP
jgi:hypothetical protein